MRDESVAVQCQLIFEPAGLGICANEDEQGGAHAMHAVSAFGAHGGMGTGDDPRDAHLAIDGLRGTVWH